MSVLIPREQVPAFYRRVGRWLADGAPPPRQPRPARTKYGPLRDHLAKLEQPQQRLSFKDLEKILEFPLPASARKYRSWWSNTTLRPPGDAWGRAGWRVAQLDLKNGWVTFERQ